MSNGNASAPETEINSSSCGCHTPASESNMGSQQIIIIANSHGTRISANEITAECDCACSEDKVCGLDSQASPIVTDDLYLRVSSLHSRFLELGRWLVFNPFAEGGVIVVNEGALRVLDFFELPHRPSDAIAAFPDFSPSQVQATVAALGNLRFLHTESELRMLSLSAPQWLSIWLHVTNNCNLRCSYCYLRKTSAGMSLSVGKRALETVFGIAEKHRFRGIKVKYAGGEPTLVFHRIIDLHQYAQTLAEQYGVDLDEVVLSNGVSITDAMADALKDNGIRLMISLDGIEECRDAQRTFANGRGSYSIVARTIERLLQRGLIPHISITISGRNIDGLPQTVAYVLERDLPFSLNFYRENDCSSVFGDLRLSEQRMIEGVKKAFRVIGESLPRRSLLGAIVDRAQFLTPHQHACGVGNNYLVIDHNGRIAKCHMEIKRTLTDIYADDPLQTIRADRFGVQNPKVDEREGCRECEWRYWCAGGCPLATFRATGRYDVKSPNCNIYKALYPEALRLEGLRLLKYHRETPSN